jgi:hypothetical protein
MRVSRQAGDCYTLPVSSAHMLVKLQTGRDNKTGPKAAVELFSALPALENQWWRCWQGTDESLSFEIASVDQITTFYMRTPVRAYAYLQSALTAIYPEILITKADRDPLAEITITQTVPPMLASIRLRHNHQLALKTYRDFADSDSLALLLSALSKAEPHEVIVFQMLVESEKRGWVQQMLEGLSEQFLPWKKMPLSSEHVQAKRREDCPMVRVQMRLAISTSSQQRNRFWLDTLQSALQAFSLPHGNELTLRPQWLRRASLLRTMQNRSPTLSPAMSLSAEEVTTLYHLPDEGLSKVNGISWGKQLAGEPPENLPIVNDKGDVCPLGKVMFKNREVTYGIRNADRRRHAYIVGKTGTGKSTLLANMAIHDINHDEGLCVIDPHGDLVETLLDYIPSHRTNDVIYIDPSAPNRVVKINPFQSKNVTHRELVASGILSIFHKLYGHSWGPRLEYILRNALLSLLPLPSPRLSDVIRILTNHGFRQQVLNKLEDRVLRDFWVKEFETMPDRLRAEAISPILNKVGQFVSSPLIRDVVDVQHSSIDLAEAMNSGKIVLANLSQGKLGEDNAALLGALLITQIQLAAMARVHQPEHERRDFYLYVDEFQNFATDSFVKVLSEARKYRLNVTLANQYVAQVPELVQKAIFGNCGTLLSFVVGAEDAGVLAREFNQVYAPAALSSLERFQMINRLTIEHEIPQAFPATSQRLASKSLQANRDKVVRVSGERYAR